MELFDIVRNLPFFINNTDTSYIQINDIVIDKAIFFKYCEPYIDDATLLKMTWEHLGITREQLVERVYSELEDIESINKAIKEYEEKYYKKFTII